MVSGHEAGLEKAVRTCASTADVRERAVRGAPRRHRSGGRGGWRSARYDPFVPSGGPGCRARPRRRVRVRVLAIAVAGLVLAAGSAWRLAGGDERGKRRDAVGARRLGARVPAEGPRREGARRSRSARREGGRARVDRAGLPRVEGLRAAPRGAGEGVRGEGRAVPRRLERRRRVREELRAQTAETGGRSPSLRDEDGALAQRVGREDERDGRGARRATVACATAGRWTTSTGSRAEGGADDARGSRTRSRPCSPRRPSRSSDGRARLPDHVPRGPGPPPRDGHVERRGRAIVHAALRRRATGPTRPRRSRCSSYDDVRGRTADDPRGGRGGAHAAVGRGRRASGRSRTTAASRPTRRPRCCAWLDAGAPEGDAGDGARAAAAPRRRTAGRSARPTPSSRSPSRRRSRRRASVPYRFVEVPTDFAEDRWVDGDRGPARRAATSSTTSWSRSCRRGARSGDGAFDPTQGFFAAMVPGRPRAALPRGARRSGCPKGTTLLFQMHYTPNGVAHEDRSSVGLIFAKEPPKRRGADARHLQPAALASRRATHNHEVEPRPRAVRRHASSRCMPHMHLRGKDFRYEAGAPRTASRETLLTCRATTSTGRAPTGCASR